MKKILCYVVGAGLLSLSQLALAQQVTMKFSHQYPPAHPVAKVIEEFKQKVGQDSEGRIEVQTYGAEQLVKASQFHMAVARGEVEAAAVNSFLWGGAVPEMAALSIPYLLSQPEQMQNFFGSEAQDYLSDLLKQKGVQPIAWLVDANDAVFTSAEKPLIAPADFNGKKIRGLSKLTDTGLRALGASPSAMPGTEVYQALQTGVLDAAITGVEAANVRHYYEVQKYAVASPFAAIFSTVVVNPKWWAGLSPEDQNILTQAALAAEKKLVPTTPVKEHAVAALREKGMTVHVLTEEEQQVLMEVMQPPVLEEFRKTSKHAEPLLDLMQKL